MYEYLNYGVVSEPLIISTLGKDLYISMHQTNSSYNTLIHALAGDPVPPEDVTVVVKYVPLIWLVWVGALLLGIGISLVFVDTLMRRRVP